VSQPDERITQLEALVLDQTEGWRKAAEERDDARAAVADKREQVKELVAALAAAQSQVAMMRRLLADVGGARGYGEIDAALADTAAAAKAWEERVMMKAQADTARALIAALDSPETLVLPDIRNWLSEHDAHVREEGRRAGILDSARLLRLADAGLYAWAVDELERFAASGAK
jgi:hypothetical protein